MAEWIPPGATPITPTPAVGNLPAGDSNWKGNVPSFLQTNIPVKNIQVSPNATTTSFNSPPQGNALNGQSNMPLIPKQNGVTQMVENTLPTIGAVGVPLVADYFTGGLATPADVGLSVAGGAAGQAVSDWMSGKKVGWDVPITGALSGVGQGAGGLVGKGLNMFGGALSKYGENMVSAGLNLTPKMAADVAKDMGVKSIKDFLIQEGLRGADFSNVGDAQQVLQDKFDAIATNPKIKVNPDDVVNGFNNEIDSLKNDLIQQPNKINALQAVRDNFKSTYGNFDSIGADTMTALRKSVDNVTKDYGTPAELASVGYKTRDILSKAIENADPSNSLDEMGNKLSQYYKLLEKADPRQYVSSGKPLFGVRDATSAFLGNIFGGPLGALGGIAVEKGLTSQAGKRGVSTGAQLLGNILQKNAVRKGLGATGALSGSTLGHLLGISP